VPVISDGQEDLPTQTVKDSPLYQYYAGTLSARDCLKRLRAEGKSTTPDAVHRSLLDTVNTLDPALGKTWKLTQIELSQSSPSSVLVVWLQQLTELEGVQTISTQSARTSVLAIAEATLPPKGQTGKRQLNLWRISTACLRWERNLETHEVVSASLEHFAEQQSRARDADNRLMAIMLKSNPAQLTLAGTVADWLFRQRAEEKRELQTLSRERDQLHRQRDELRAEVAQHLAIIASLGKDLDNERTRYRQLDEQMRQARNHAIRRIRSVAGEAIRGLSQTLNPALSHAKEALSATTPQADVAAQFVTMAFDECERLDVWLRAELTSEPPTV